MLIFNTKMPELDLAVTYDPETERVSVSDIYGSFVPFPLLMWQKCVTVPYQNYFVKKGKSVEVVINMFLGEYRYFYYCKN